MFPHFSGSAFLSLPASAVLHLAFPAFLGWALHFALVLRRARPPIVLLPICPCLIHPPCFVPRANQGFFVF
jgi:hypothetical protein